MDKLDKLGDNVSDEQKERLGKIQDLARRFDEGAPADNISGVEAAATYKAVSSQLTPEQLEEATAEALGKLPPEDRQQVSQWMRQASGGQLADLDDDPRTLAAASRQLGSAQGGADGLLGGLFGGAQNQATAGGGGSASDLLDNPLVKSVLAGVASVAVSKFMGGGAQAGGGLSGLLGGILGGGGGGGSRGGGGGLDDILGGLIGGGGGGSQGGGGGLDDILGGLIGGGGQGRESGQKPPTKRNIL